MIEAVQIGVRRSSFQLLKPYFRSLLILHHLSPLDADCLKIDVYTTREPHCDVTYQRRHSFLSF
jgi:hypothetical protein